MFVKGQSGNPSGRPKMPEDLKKSLKEGAAEAVKIWRDIQNDETASKRDRLKAGELLMAYGYGKAVQPVEVDGDVTSRVVDTSKLSPESQDAIVSLLAVESTAPDSE